LWCRVCISRARLPNYPKECRKIRHFPNPIDVRNIAKRCFSISGIVEIHFDVFQIRRIIFYLGNDRSITSSTCHVYTLINTSRVTWTIWLLYPNICDLRYGYSWCLQVIHLWYMMSCSIDIPEGCAVSSLHKMSEWIQLWRICNECRCEKLSRSPSNPKGLWCFRLDCEWDSYCGYDDDHEPNAKQESELQFSGWRLESCLIVRKRIDSLHDTQPDFNENGNREEYKHQVGKHIADSDNI